MSAPKLTPAQWAFLAECSVYSLCENYGRSGYIRLGGSGLSPIRRNDTTRRTLENHGLLVGGSVIKASAEGYRRLAERTAALAKAEARP